MPPKSTRRAKVLPVTMTSPHFFFTFGCGHRLKDADVQILAAVSFLHGAEISVLQEPWENLAYLVLKGIGSLFHHDS